MSFNPKEFLEDPSSITIPDSIQAEVIQENWLVQTKYLKSLKNVSNGAILVKYVTIIPPAFEKVINKLVREVK